MTSSVPVICVDGPSGAGKGTLSQHLANAFSWHLLDSGALYRVVGYACRQANVSLDDETAVAEMARALNVDFQPGEKGVTVWLSDQDVTAGIRSEQGGLDACLLYTSPSPRDS